LKNNRKYKKHFRADKLISFVKSRLNELGVKLVYSSLLLYFAFSQKDTSRWAKNIIIGALGYLLSPIDAIPDLTPFLGFTDDLGVVLFGLVGIACYITDEVRDNAKRKISQWFSDVNPEIMAEVDILL
jgi:uncharacterized membrane protein YkvA (DUF1232 family)